MADTTAQREVSNWILSSYLKERFGEIFTRRRLQLETGGIHEFAAVSPDGKMVGTVITSQAKTAAGKLGVGKLTKVRADLYFLVLTRSEVRFVVFTDAEMYSLVKREQSEFKRIPASIRLLLADLPDELRSRLDTAQGEASQEVSPR